jgi:hypothetical protein
MYPTLFFFQTTSKESKKASSKDVRELCMSTDQFLASLQELKKLADAVDREEEELEKRNREIPSTSSTASCNIIQTMTRGKAGFNPTPLIKLVMQGRETFFQKSPLEDHLPIKNLLQSWEIDVSTFDLYKDQVQIVQTEMLAKAIRRKSFLDFMLKHYADALNMYF